MRSTATRRTGWTLLLFAGLLFGLVTVPAHAQTGPGGVGNASGSPGQPENVLWLRADEGVSTSGGVIDTWADQSGNNNDTPRTGGNPTLVEDALNGRPVVRFDGDGDEFGRDNIGDLGQVSNDDNTIIVVSKRSSDDPGQGIIDFDRSDPGSFNDFFNVFIGVDFQSRSIGYNLNLPGDNFQSVTFETVSWAGGLASESQAIGTGSFNILSSIARGVSSGRNLDLGANGAVVDDDPNQATYFEADAYRIGAFGPDSRLALERQFGLTATEANFLDGDIAEVIVFPEAINAAQYQIISNYLAEKYGLSVAADLYRFASHPGDVAGIGRQDAAIGQAVGGSHTAAETDILGIQNPEPLADGDFLLIGHDEADRNFVPGETPDDRRDVEKLDREWRVDLTQMSESTVDVEVDADPLTLGTEFNDFALYVDPDGDFSDGNATFYDLDGSGGSGSYTATNVTLQDGDYVTIARINRVVRFTTSLRTEFEPGSGSIQPAINVETTFPSSSALTVPIRGSRPAGNEPDAQDGSSCLFGGNPCSGFTIPSGVTTVDINSRSNPFLTISQDNEREPFTEFLNLTLESTGTARAGEPATLEFGIVDDADNPDQVQFAGGNPSSIPEGDDGSTRTSADIELASGGPVTVRYEITGPASPGVDYQIVGDSDPTTSVGTVQIPAGSPTASIPLDIFGDEIDERPSETLTIRLAAVEAGGSDATNATIDPSNNELTITIEDDDPLPDVTFTSAGYTGKEGTLAQVGVVLSRQTNYDVTVGFSDDTGTGQPQQGSDYIFSSPEAITIPAGNTEGTLTIPLASDGEDETVEDIQLSIAPSETDGTVPSDGQTSATVSILNTAGVGARGPGGVGSKGSLPLWLAADDGAETSGNSLTAWRDLSANGNDAVPTGSGAPQVGSIPVNGESIPVIDFNSSPLELSGISDLGSRANTVFTIFRSNQSAAQGLFSIADVVVRGTGAGVTPARTLRIEGGGSDLVAQNGTGSVTQSGLTNDLTLAASRYEPGEGLGLFGSLGNLLSNLFGGSSGSSQDGNTAILGASIDLNNGQEGTTEPFEGEIAEVIAYETALNRAQSVIVSNYLASKYSLSLDPDEDIYSGESGPDGTAGTIDDYDRSVFGVGQIEGESHLRASSAGLTFSVRNGLDNGDFLMAGKTEQSSNQPSTVGALPGPVTARSLRDRFVEVSGNGLSVDIAVDLSRFGLRGPSGVAENYVLLSRSNPSDDWSVLATGAATFGNRVSFTDVSIPNGFQQYVTIATTNFADSPLDTRYTALHGEASTAPAGQNGPDAGYRTLGLPIQGATAGDILRPDGTKLFTSSNLSLSGLGGSTGILYRWDYSTQQFDSVTDPTGDLPNGRGFYIWAKDDTNFPVSPDLIFGVQDTSTVPTEAVTVTVPDASGRYVFPANPYLSAYDMGAFTDLAANGFDATIASWDPDNGGRYGSYVVKTQYTRGDEISRYQGFYLRRSEIGTGTTAFTFDPSGKRGGELEPLVGTKTQVRDDNLRYDYRRIGLKLRVENDDGEEIMRDVAATILFHEKAGSDWDPYDAPKYRPPSARYATLAPVGTGEDGGDQPKAQESRSYTPSGLLEIPLEVRTRNVTGSLVLSAESLEFVPGDWSITLVDTRGTDRTSDDVQTDLSETGAEYRFEFSASAKTPPPKQAERSLQPEAVLLRPKPDERQKAGGKSRFIFRIEPSSALPVELSEFTARRDGEDVILNWSTATETNNAGFAVEQKLGKEDYKEVEFVRGSGTVDRAQSYSYRVKDVAYGNHQFRLRQVDQDGGVSYSDSRSVEVRLRDEYQVEGVYPNPARDAASLGITVQRSQQVRVELYDVLGRQIRTIHHGRLPGQQTKRLRINSQSLSSGQYFIRVTGESFVETRRLTVL